MAQEFVSKCLGQGKGPDAKSEDLEDVAPQMDADAYVKKSETVRLLQSSGPIIYSVKKPVRNLFSVKGTAIKMVVCSFDFFLLNLLHIILLIVFQKHGIKSRQSSGRVETNWYRITNEMFTVLSPLLVFVLVFYNNQAYNRYMEQFFTARKLEGRIKYITNRLRAYFRGDPFPGAEESMRAILRTVVVAHYCLFLHLPRYRKKEIYTWGWDYLQKYKLVTKEEYEVLHKKSGPDVMGEALAFCTERLGQHVRHGHIDSITYMAFEEDLHMMVFFVMTITAYANNPVPFAYYHLANLLTLGKLMLVAYSFVFLDSYLTIIVFALLTVALLGLRDLSCALADPFGIDDTDFPTIIPTATSHVSNEKLLSRDSVFGSAALTGHGHASARATTASGHMTPTPVPAAGSFSSPPSAGATRRNGGIHAPTSSSPQAHTPPGTPSAQNHRSPSLSPRRGAGGHSLSPPPTPPAPPPNGRGGGGRSAAASSAAGAIELSSDAGSGAAVWTDAPVNPPAAQANTPRMSRYNPR